MTRRSSPADRRPGFLNSAPAAHAHDVPGRPVCHEIAAKFRRLLTKYPPGASADLSVSAHGVLEYLPSVIFSRSGIIAVQLSEQAAVPGCSEPHLATRATGGNL
jgi:hypothetical protein